VTGLEPERARLQIARELNTLHQLVHRYRDEVLTLERAMRLDEHIREARRILHGREKDPPRAPSTRRRRLWKRQPNCFWCGRVTDISTAFRANSATVEHIYPMRHPRRKDTRRVLPSTVLACFACNQERGAPPVPPTFGRCPVLALVAATRQ